MIIRRWRKMFDEEERLCGIVFLGLLPQKKQIGNKNPKINSTVQNLMSEVIEKRYYNIKQLNMKAV
ncbi:hypothetical protein COI41_22240 [Bacillus toyonensis]|uniref:hypothetical protein n=2 Tax=Bacillus TaxID=1386 RepID=UPI000BFBE25C|nr:hypothetical protein [Bacillus toyonensis]PHF52265.1 hypothetical protein COI41_22240 [Bacillus toyonensis]